MFFTEHGIFEVKVEDNTLLVDATGPFNEELIIKYEKSLESCIGTLEHTNWNQIIILRQFSVFTPEAEQKLTQTLRNRKSKGLVACVVVLKDIESEALVKSQMSRCYEYANIKYEFTTSVDDAKKWLATL